jgi:hypothetical protein
MMVKGWVVGPGGNTLKLREPLERALQSRQPKGAGGQANRLGYWKNVRDVTYNGLSAAKLLRPMWLQRRFRDLMAVGSASRHRVL